MAYGKKPDTAFAGMKADSGNDRVESYATVAILPFGVVATSNINGTMTVGGVGSGITVQTWLYPDINNGYPAKTCGGLMVQGNVWAKVDEGADVTVNAPAKFVASTGVISNGGANTLAHSNVRDVVVLNDGSRIAQIQLNVPRA